MLTVDAFIKDETHANANKSNRVDKILPLASHLLNTGVQSSNRFQTYRPASKGNPSITTDRRLLNLLSTNQ